MIVAESLESHDELEAAQQTFTEAATHLLTDVPEPPYATHPVLFGRHRVRRMLGLPHDNWDSLADTLHSSPVSLDELHDPKRVWSLGSDNPAELEAEISRLRAELGTYREALSRPFPVAVLHWPAPELTELLTAYPSLAEEYPSHEEHLATIEGSLRELAASGTPNLGIVTGTVPSYEAFAASEGLHLGMPRCCRSMRRRWRPGVGLRLGRRSGGRLVGVGRGGGMGSATETRPEQLTRQLA